MLKDCVASIHARSTYTNYEIIIIENNSETEEIHACYQELQKDARVRVIYWEGEFNYASINNFGVKQAKGEYLLFLNNDITVITPDWIQELLMFVQRSDVGAAGAKLYYPDGSIQHAGVIVGIGGYAGHAFKRGRPEELGSGYMCRLDITQNLSAVTGACLMVRKAVFDAISGFDSLYKVAANDVDICLRIRRAGYLVVFTPFAELYHYESKTRGYEDTPEKQARLEKELSAFRARWKDVLEQGDPYYNPNLTLDHEDLSYKQIKMRNFIRLFRPKQWTKNGIVFAALIFSGNFFTWPLLLRTLEGVAVFCAISSAVYILNDIVDRKKDAEHPSKCRRPIASGAISVPVAAAISGGLFLFGFAAAWMLNLYFALVILAYVVINVFYTFHLKNIPILDIMCIAAGFVLRALSGSFLIQVGISPWLIVCTMLLSLFLAIQKRRSEFLRMKELGKEGRAVLRYYTADLLRDMCSVIDSATIMAYCLYTINQERAIPMMFTIPFVIYGLFRYQLIVHTMDLAETPEMALLKDRPLLIDILLWGATCMGIIYFL